MYGMNRLLTDMLAQADPSQVEGLSRFFKTGLGQYGEGDKFLGIKVPVTRAVVKGCWRELGTPWGGFPEGGSEGGSEGGFPELEECIRSEYHEVRLAALLALVEIFSHSKSAGNYFSEGFPKNQFPAEGLAAASSCPTPTGHLRQQCVDFYLAHTQYINNWDLVDLSCYPLLGVWLLDSPDRSLLYDLARNGRTLWEQRIGIVSTMTFVRHGQLEDTFAIADILLHHPHDLIHKAVGWLLREAGKRDQAALVAYLQGAETPGGDVMPGPDRASLPRYRTMPRTMLRYAIEKFPEAERQQYLTK